MLFMESTILEQWWPGNPWARRYRMEDKPAMGEQRVDWLVGAAVISRSEAVEQAGPLDEGFFMYSEELEWQHRLTHANRRSRNAIVYLAGAVVVHHEGKSSEQNMLRRHINFQRSKLRYARRRFGALTATSLKVFLLATYLLQAVIESGKWLLGHKRRLRAARVRQYLRIFASGL
jgi:GT2 family glycosyltransferase